MPRLLFTPGKDPVPFVQEARFASGPVCTGAENLAPTGVQYPNRRACSQSLYRLSYTAHYLDKSLVKYYRNWEQDFTQNKIFFLDFVHKFYFNQTFQLKFAKVKSH